jgi:hypothetical protein
MPVLQASNKIPPVFFAQKVQFWRENYDNRIEEEESAGHIAVEQDIACQRRIF